MFFSTAKNQRHPGGGGKRAVERGIYAALMGIATGVPHE
jgi:hypothetical protein